MEMRRRSCILGTFRFVQELPLTLQPPKISRRIAISFICISHSREKTASSFLKHIIEEKNCSCSLSSI